MSVGLLVEGCPIFLGTLEHSGVKLGLVDFIYFREKFPSPGEASVLE